MEQRLFVCKCGSLEHQFVITTDDDYAYIGIHLSPLPFWQRVKHSVGYLFGRRCRYGDFEEITMDPIMALTLGDYLLSWASGESSGFPPSDVY